MKRLTASTSLTRARCLVYMERRLKAVFETATKPRPRALKDESPALDSAPPSTIGTSESSAVRETGSSATKSAASSTETSGSAERSVSARDTVVNTNAEFTHTKPTV